MLILLLVSLLLQPPRAHVTDTPRRTIQNFGVQQLVAVLNVKYDKVQSKIISDSKVPSITIREVLQEGMESKQVLVMRRVVSKGKVVVDTLLFAWGALDKYWSDKTDSSMHVRLVQYQCCAGVSRFVEEYVYNKTQDTFRIANRTVFPYELDLPLRQTDKAFVFHASGTERVFLGPNNMPAEDGMSKELQQAWLRGITLAQDTPVWSVAIKNTAEGSWQFVIGTPAPGQNIEQLFHGDNSDVPCFVAGWTKMN